ncbi:unnamed protein product [Schistocephalus solidus]|uniref:C2H2-type domain-containing protein n=1 Tax=Schistocephalus solidus TaxID=70667 RepID=A0A183SU68_SCHSO|nr:unnamed protein product [Schistocephalus solidus]
MNWRLMVTSGLCATSTPSGEEAADGFRDVLHVRERSLKFGTITIFAAEQDVEEGKLVVFFLLHRGLHVREYDFLMPFEFQHLIPFDHNEAIYEANRITAAKAKRATRKSSALRANTADAQPLPTCPRCLRTFRARIGLVGHARTQCTNNPTIPPSTSNSANSHSDSPTLTPGINSFTHTIIKTTSQYSSPVTPTTATATATTTTTSDGGLILNCPQCDRTFNSRIGLIGHLRIHRTETGELVP